MEPFDLFCQYRAERLGRPFTAYKVEVFPDLTRYTAVEAGGEGWVMFAQLDPAASEERIREQIRHFQNLGQSFEWKVYDFDTPASLKTLLESHGFSCGEKEAFLSLAVDDWTERPPPLPPGVRLEKIRDPGGIPDFIKVEEAAFGQLFPEHGKRYLNEMNAGPDSISFYCAYLGDQPVAAGRMTLPADSAFAELWSGCVVPALRGQGLYTAILDCRIREARARGYQYVTVDAEPMSRPILTGKGFRHICWTYPMALPPPASANCGIR